MDLGTRGDNGSRSGTALLDPERAELLAGRGGHAPARHAHARSMLSAIPHSESTPPLYYVLAWVWVRVFSAGEVGLRSLSALIGTATIVLLALIARRLAAGAPGSQQRAVRHQPAADLVQPGGARLRAAGGVLRALALVLLREDWRGFALASALALATHYSPSSSSRRSSFGCAGSMCAGRAAAWSAAFVVAVAAALMPLAVAQASATVLVHQRE